MPKNVSCNSFYMFMIETKKRLESRGERFPRGMEDVVSVAGELWANMSAEQKNIYKDKAKDYKKSDEFSNHKKEMRAKLPKKMREEGETSRRRVQDRPLEEEEFVEPVPYLYPSDDEEAQEEFRKKHLKDRTEILDAWRWNMADNKDGVIDMKCFVISFVSHCRTSAYSYFPAEVGIVEFSLRQGVIRSFSRIMGPHAIPDNLIPMATHNFDSHKISFKEGAEAMTNDYGRVLDEILRFCRPSKNLRRLFCIGKEFNCVQGCLKFLQTQAKLVEIRPDRINCAEDLFILLCEWKEKSCAPAEWRTFNDCDGLVPSAPHFGNPDLLCEYHQQLGVHHCALATAKRTAYYLISRIHTHYRFPKTQRHEPAPMPEGAIQANVAAAQSRREMNLATASLQALKSRNDAARRQLDDDDMSTITRATTTASRRADMEDDVGMPRTLPSQLHAMIGTADAPDVWHPDDKNYLVLEPPRSVQTPSISGRDSPSDTVSISSRIASINWNQNKDVRDFVYQSSNVTAPRNANAARGPSQAKQSGAHAGNHHVSTAPQNRFSYASAARPTGFQQQRGVAPVPPPMASVAPMIRQEGGNNVITSGIPSSLSSDFGGLRCAPQPISYPPPQNARIQAQNIGVINENGLSGARQRGLMRPRIALPPSLANNNIGIANNTLAPRPIRPSGVAQNIGYSAAPQQEVQQQSQQPATSSNGQAVGPPKTQSRVKQMLAERMRYQQDQPPHNG